MAKKFLAPIDMNFNEILKMVLQNLASDPSTSGLKKGYAFFNSTENVPKYYNGTTIVPIGDYLTGANVGASGIGIFYQKASGQLQFKKVVAGSKTTVTDNGDTVTINVGTLAISDITSLQTTLDGKASAASVTAKADKVASPTNGHILTTDATGQPTDSGKSFNDSGATTNDVWSASKTQSAINTAAQGIGNSIHTPVQTLANAKALTDYIDKQLLLIEDLGTYRFDAQSTATADDNLVIQPTNIAGANPGRWLKMSNLLTDHNLLSNIQGGTTGEYNHLTNAEKTAATRNATSGQNGLLAATDFASFNSRTKKAAGDIGDGVSTTINFAHNLGTTDIVVSIIEKATNAGVETDWSTVDTNNISISFATAPTAAQFRVVVVG